ncbi:hypothetical protein EIP91_004141 [Steccherinum ochraceum]|uniref:glucan 1,3-beta-glucosidase n=1 Tax=Steccherinum ochraceum TaxID=92696 RepID=A0A4R0RCG5_9APHY|nr:hypothetical protein EIP91_004141 [Steccherinum ochraceum]
MSDTENPFLTPRSRPLTTASSADNLNDGSFIPPNPHFSRDSTFGPQPSLSPTPRGSAVLGEPNTNSYYGSIAGASNNNVPLLDQDGGLDTPRSGAGKEYGGLADRSEEYGGSAGKKSLFRRPLFWAGLIAAIVVVVLAVILPVYFVVIKPNNRSASSPSGASTNNGGSSGNGAGSGNSTGTGNGGQKVLITGGDGSTITKDDGTTFVYNNSFGGFWYEDPTNPFADAAQPNSWTPPLNQTWQWGVNRVYGVNLGGLFVLEPFIVPALYQSLPGAADEWAISQALRGLPTGDNLTAAMEDHYNTFITEEDIAQIAGAGLNWIRLPVPFWAISSWDNVGNDASGNPVSEPYATGLCWKYVLRIFKWARKYGLRVELDLHTAPGSQNGYNHSGKSGQINFLAGPMGVANAQRMLDYIRVFTEFISQPEYTHVVPAFGIINEALVKNIGQDQMSAFYLHAYNMIRSITGTGEGHGPYMVIHDGFIGLNSWAGFLSGSDRIAIDTHPYFAFDGQPNPEMINLPADGDATQWGGKWPLQACKSWGGSLNDSRSAFGVTFAGEFSNAINDCGLYINGITNGHSSTADCDFFSDASQWDDNTKKGLLNFALASMDALGDWFFWTWKIGESQAGKVGAPLWSYSLGLQEGWMPKDPRTALGKCASLGAPSDPFDGNFQPWQTGGAGAGSIAASASAQLPWPPASITKANAAGSLLPTYTATASIITLSPSAVATNAATKNGDGWFNAQDNSPMVTTVAGCTYPDAWSAADLPVPTQCTGAAAKRADEPRITGTPFRRPPQDGYYPEDYDNAGRYTPQSQTTSPFEQRVSRTAGANSGVLRHSQQQYPTEIQHNPYGYDQPQVPFTTEPDELSSSSNAAINRARGISLADNGPVPGPEGVRRVSRQPNRRSSSQAPAPQQNRYSRSSFPTLPPGAAPPQPGGYGL